MDLHVYEFGGYGVRAFDELDALDTLREHEGENVADELVDCGHYPALMDDAAPKTIDTSTDEEPRLVTKTCAEWIANAESDILWRPE